MKRPAKHGEIKPRSDDSYFFEWAKMNLQLNIFKLTLLLSLAAFANEPCPKIDIPQDRKVMLSIEQQSLENSEAWAIQSAFVVNRTVAESFERAKKFERLEHIIPLINIFNYNSNYTTNYTTNLSEDRKILEVGIKLLPGLSFRQTFQITVLEYNQSLLLQFTEGSFAGLAGQVCFSTFNTHQTAVVVNSTGKLKNNPVPFFVTNSMLEAISKSIIRRWRNQIETQ